MQQQQHVLGAWMFFVFSLPKWSFTHCHRWKNSLYCEHQQTADNWIYLCVCVRACKSVKNWTFEVSSRNRYLLAATDRGCLWILSASGINRSGMPWILQFIKEHKTEPLNKMLIMRIVSAYRLFKLGKQENWGFGKKNLHWKRYL